MEYVTFSASLSGFALATKVTLLGEATPRIDDTTLKTQYPHTP
ncbi:MAG: hypothetical protein ABSB53_07500 [Nitrososphaerales archaeon]